MKDVWMSKAHYPYHTVYKLLLPSSGKRILVACGPGNNGT